MEGQRKYNSCLDFIKGIACICVVLMHCEFPGTLGVVTQAVSRFCVPFFFMVSGYFCYSKDGSPVPGIIVRKKVPHILRIVLGACLFYLCFVLLQQAVWHDRSFVVTPRQIRNFLFFNVPFIVAGQYWFLFALLYTYLLYAVIERLKLGKYSYLMGILMLVAYYVLAQGAHLAGINVPNMVYRNWLVEGFAFFILGRWIYEHKDRIAISDSVLLWTVGISTVLCLVERYLLGRDFGVNICTLPQVFALFVYAVKNPDRHPGMIQRIGRDCSMLVYVFHPFVWHSMERVYKGVGISDNTVALYMMPIAVVVLSILLSVFWNWAADVSKRSRKKI